MSENYEFGPFSVDPVERLVWCRGNRVALKGKPFEVLLHLLESGGQALAKEALMGRVWPDAIVEESNLTVAVSQLRRALRGADAQREYVETLPGRGYRFLAHGQPARPRRGRTTADSGKPVAFHADSGRAREARALFVGRQVESATLVPALEEAREGAYAILAEVLMLAGRLDEALVALKTRESFAEAARLQLAERRERS
jgi:DNA-binding winged helix-turn-helix (wHTH) protein